MSETSTLITVTELTYAIKNHLEPRFAHLTVQGEISNAKLHSSGHFYFDLKDAESKIGAVMFRPQCQILKKIPKEGDQVIVKGSLSIYPPHGKYQMMVRSLEFMGLGELLLKLEALKKKLHGLGWFDRERKKKPPPFPKTIGVVTSPTGAVIRDILTVLARRSPGFHLILYPVRVQGAGAAEEIARAIQDFNRYSLADVLIVGRGGGSLEDLWSFNEEVVAKAIYESQIPIISAVGHETDVTIADFVASVRAPTPSAAAEIVSAETAQWIAYLKGAQKTAFNILLQQYKQVKTELMGYKRHPLFATPYTFLAGRLQKLDEIEAKIDEKMQSQILYRKYLLAGRQKQQQALKPTVQLTLCRNRLTHFQKNISEKILGSLKLKKLKLIEVVHHLQALDPKNVLKRGYAILFSENRDSAIVSALGLSPGQRLHALLSDGEVRVEVQDMTPIPLEELVNDD